ncbi:MULTISPECIES: hypothetical protein [unclassified Bradyrhizobium]
MTFPISQLGNEYLEATRTLPALLKAKTDRAIALSLRPAITSGGLSKHTFGRSRPADRWDLIDKAIGTSDLSWREAPSATVQFCVRRSDDAEGDAGTGERPVAAAKPQGSVLLQLHEVKMTCRK